MLSKLAKFDASRPTVFLDFDGVLKDSVRSKSFAYEHAFRDASTEVVSKIIAHHECNGGVSRYEKIPIYLRMAGLQVTDQAVRERLRSFAESAKLNVLQSNWMPGARELIAVGGLRINLMLFTATPYGEMINILEELDILPRFCQVKGAPLDKGQVIANTLIAYELPTNTIFVGDSFSDFEAATYSGVQFWYFNRSGLIDDRIFYDRRIGDLHELLEEIFNIEH